MPNIRWTPSQATTTIAAGSNGAVLPVATLSVASTTGFPTSGTVEVVTSDGRPTRVTYTGLGTGTLTGCSGGQGTLATGGSVHTVIPEVANIVLGERGYSVSPMEAVYVEDADLSAVQTKLAAISGSTAVLPW